MKPLLPLILLSLFLGAPARADDHYSFPPNSAFHVASTTALQASPTATYINGVWRDDYSSGLGAPPLFYTPSNSACSLNAGAGDGGSQVPSADGKCWIASFPSSGEDVREWGCQTGGSSDCNTAIVAAISYVTANGGRVLIPGNARSSLALLFGAAPVAGTSPITPSNPPSGSKITCDITVLSACVTVGGSGATATGGNVENLIVGFASGTPAAGQNAFVFRGHNGICSRIMAVNAYDAITFVNGLSLHCSYVYTGNIQHDHLVQNGAPEWYIVNARFGQNGVGDQANSDAFIGITGNNPNTLFCTDCQFNLGGLSPHYLVNYYGVSNEVDGIVQISASTVDMGSGNCQSLIKTDATAFVYRLQISHTIINAPGCRLIDQTTQSNGPVSMEIVNNPLIAIADTTFDTGAVVSQISFDVSDNADITGSITLNSGNGNGTVGGRAIFSRNGLEGNLTVTSTKPWTRLDMASNQIGGTYSDSATGSVYANTPNVAWTPTLLLGGGAATGFTYTSNGLAHRNLDGSYTAIYGLTVTVKGSATGRLALSGVPFICVAGYGLGAGGYGSPNVLPTYAFGVTGVTGMVAAFLNQGAASVLFEQGSAAGLAQLTDANIPASPSVLLSGTLACPPV